MKINDFSIAGVTELTKQQLQEIEAGGMYIWKLLGFLFEGQVIAIENCGPYQYGAVAFK